MLFAEIAGKLGPEALDHERREDTLTSSVIGTLLVADACVVLRDWLCRARTETGEQIPHIESLKPCRFWFWPRLSESEPDVVLQLGAVLVVVEAKYLASKSGSGAADEDDEESDTGGLDSGQPVDQLAREWRSCDPRAPLVEHYPSELRDAIAGAERRFLVYLVRGPQLRKARDEMRLSRTLLGPDAALYLLTWEELHVTLRGSDHRDRMWAGPLLRLLERRDLSGFRGFPHSASRAQPVVAAFAQRPSRLAPLRSLHFPDALRDQDHELAAGLAAQQPRLHAMTLKLATAVERANHPLVFRLAAHRIFAGVTRVGRSTIRSRRRLMDRASLVLVRKLAGQPLRLTVEEDK